MAMALVLTLSLVLPGLECECELMWVGATRVAGVATLQVVVPLIECNETLKYSYSKVQSPCSFVAARENV